jgi:hypothetical protein
MSQNSQKQNGSVLTVGIIILIIAIIGLLGFIVWQNLTSKSTDTSTGSSTTETIHTDPYEDWNTYESINSKYSIKYPKDWQALKETVQDGPYIRNFDPTSKQSQNGYPEGYINVRILIEENNANFKAMTGYTTTEWYDALGKIQLQNGASTHSPEDVKELKIGGLPAKSTKAVFTETNEILYVLRGDKLYSINLYPYGISSDPAVKLMLDSFKFTY